MARPLHILLAFVLVAMIAHPFADAACKVKPDAANEAGEAVDGKLTTEARNKRLINKIAFDVVEKKNATEPIGV
ncbi:hypothetical protein P43SY_001390 [Pythium insidiosum]|uniref:RxLR effector protein n=1 Tax=Pythium insidiosum TaxID=114742 RepID=A0AAD5QC65_PYTIN|nr:hypothetical protein P43SY_001390 [Pythium insidiosum]